MVKPNIFDYSDYKSFLKDSYQYNKSLNRNFTHRFIIERVHASSSGWFSDLLKGRINLSSMYRLRLSELFELSEPEDEYFNNLVNYEQATSAEERSVFFKRIIQNKQPEAELVLQNQFDFYRFWYISAIREILLDYAFDGTDYAQLGKLLVPEITEREARFAVDLLLKCELIEFSDGRFQPTSQNIKKSTEFSSFYWKLYMDSMLSLSKNAIEYPKEKRDISAITINLSPANFVEAQILVADLRKKLLRLSEADDNNHTYQCNFQIFPLSNEF